MHYHRKRSSINVVTHKLIIPLSHYYLLQKKPLNVITWEDQNDQINQIISIIGEIYLLVSSKLDLEMWSHWAVDNINQ